jgi:hypothetical protein
MADRERESGQTVGRWCAHGVLLQGERREEKRGEKDRGEMRKKRR